MNVRDKTILDKLGSCLFQLAEQSQDIVWIRSSEWNEYLYISPSCESIWGVNPQALYESPGSWLDKVVVEDRDPLRQKLIEFLAEVDHASSFEAEYRVHGNVKKVKWIREYAFPVFDQGRCLFYCGIANDITHLKKNSKKIENASYFFKLFTEKIESVFWVRNKAGTKQLYLSPSYEKVWGRPRSLLYDNPNSWIDALMPEDRELNQLSEHQYSSAKDCQEEKIENRYRITRPSGEIRWIKDTSFPICDEEGEFVGIAGIADDITADVLRERELLEAKENAEKANQAKSDFLAMISHELRTPLNAVLGMVQILERSDLTEEQRNYVEVISQAGQNLLSLLSDLLDFAKIEAGELRFENESIDLKKFVTQVFSDMKSQAGAKSLAFKLNYTITQNRQIICDPKRLRQVLVNLLSNAIKFTEQGHVILTVSLVQRSKSTQVICFTVEDSGIGIDKSKLKTIFGRFQQIDSVYQRKHDGVGLGLAIVKDLVEKMGGNIMVSSEPGVGSQFSCILSFEVGEQEQPSPLSVISNDSYAAQPQRKHYNFKVLVVEDNLINQKISRLMLEQLGCHVDIAECSSVALEKMINQYDLIFMDIGLPDKDGFQTVEEIRKMPEMETIPIVAMTAHVFKQDRERCFQVGMNDVIAKPIVQSRLIEILDKCKPRQHCVP